MFGILVFQHRLLDLPPIAYTTAMRESPDGVFIVDADGYLVHTNERGETLLALFELSVGDHVKRTLPAFTTADQQFSSTDQIAVDDGGELRHFTVRSQELDRAGRAVGQVLVFTDVTEMKQYQKQLERKNERLNKFASVVSHDLRNPLNVAQLYTELAQDTGELTHLDSVNDAHERMEEMIATLLTLARANVTVTETEAQSLSDMIHIAWENIENGETTLNNTVPQKYALEMDPELLPHILENLFRNANEHGRADDEPEAGTDPLTVTVGLLHEDDDIVGFFVEDDGVGIPPTDRERVFEHGHSSIADGTGLGLSIVSDFVTAHGWDIRVTEAATGGARFEIFTVGTPH